VTEDTKANQEHPDEPPPFLGTWNRIYTVVLLYLVVLIIVFYIFGAVFTP
jgi:hypothetical protein